jgi:hypothetical protein
LRLYGGSLGRSAAPATEMTSSDAALRRKRSACATLRIELTFAPLDFASALKDSALFSSSVAASRAFFSASSRAAAASSCSTRACFSCHHHPVFSSETAGFFQLILLSEACLGKREVVDAQSGQIRMRIATSPSAGRPQARIGRPPSLPAEDNKEENKTPDLFGVLIAGSGLS